MSSLVELPSVGSSPGYTIKLFTDPQKHSKTYEIKHGDKIFTVVENKDEINDNSEESGLVRSLHPVKLATSSSADDYNTNLVPESKISSFEQNIIHPKAAVESATSGINTNLIVDQQQAPVKTTTTVIQQQQQQQQQDFSQVALASMIPNKSFLTSSSNPNIVASSDVLPSQKSTSMTQEPSTLNTVSSISSQVKEAIPSSSITNSMKSQNDLSPKLVMPVSSSTAPTAISRKQVEKPKPVSPSSSSIQQQLNTGADAPPTVTLQSTIHKEVMMNGQPQHIVNSFVSEEYNNNPIQQNAKQGKPSSFTEASSTVDEMKPDQLTSSSTLLRENPPQSSPSVSLKSITTSSNQAESQTSADIPTLSDLVKPSKTKNINSMEMEAFKNDHNNKLADDASIIPSTLNSLEKLKTLLPAFIGTRKTELPSTSTAKALPYVNTLTSPMKNNIINNAQANEDPNGNNAWSQEIRGVTSLSSSKTPVSNDDLFNKTLNADIILK